MYLICNLISSTVESQLSGLPLLYGSRKYPYSPHRRSLEIPGWRGDIKAKLLEESMNLNWKFLGGGGEGMQNQKPSVGEYGYFLELLIRWPVIKVLMSVVFVLFFLPLLSSQPLLSGQHPFLWG